jgi:hypothetical protein
MTRYLRKQVIIVFVFLLIVAVITAGAYFIFRPRPEATCFDGIKNQGEFEADCGGPCLPCEKEREALEIIRQEIIPTSENNFDLVIEVKNPNNNWGAKSVGYSLDIYDQENNNIFSKKGGFYILPQENKYIIEPKIFLEQNPDRAEVKIISTSWERPSGIRELALRIRDKKIQSGEGFQSRVSGVVNNSTNYDLGRVELVGIIFNTDREIIAAGRTEVNTLLRNENRYFEIIWPHTINETIGSYDIKAYTDVFSKDNFIEAKDRDIQR